MAEEKKVSSSKKGMAIKPAYAAAVVIALVIIVGAAYALTSSAPKVVAGDNVSVYYKGSFTNGTVFNDNFGTSQPLIFIAGSNQLIPGFSNAVIGMSLNQTKNITLPVNEAYGPINPSLVISVPISVFGNNTKNLTVGGYVTSTSGSTGIIDAINASNVIVNFNPPLAGKALVFEIKVVKIQKA
jgi:FKBP-type peptidyl-prolyl cis-trans isomerase 2